MPPAKIHILECQYSEVRMNGVSAAIEEALINVLKVRPDDFYQIIHVLPPGCFPHATTFLGLKYSDELIVLDLTLISGRSKDTRLDLFERLNERIVARAGISPDDLLIQLYEFPGANISFGRGLAQRASVSAAS